MCRVDVQRVTLSDCGRALDSIETELCRLEAQKREVERKIAALRTQALMILKVARETT